jgi:hypothetical protein
MGQLFEPIEADWLRETGFADYCRSESLGIRKLAETINERRAVQFKTFDTIFGASPAVSD